MTDGILTAPSQLKLQKSIKHDEAAEESECEYMDDLRIEGQEPLCPASVLAYQLPLSRQSKQTIAKARRTASEILLKQDNRVILIVGPCSIHDVDAALEYGRRLKELSEVPVVKENVLVLMRTYFEKPRSTVGWKGLSNDPFLDGSFEINEGLRICRKLLSDLTHCGVPVSAELLDTISPQYFADTISWGAIGARTTESQLHRELASGVSFPIGFKNGTDGSSDIAADAVLSARHSHRFLGVTHQGLAAITKTTGNPDCHIILRGGKTGPNFDAESVQNVKALLTKKNLDPRIMVDCSHGNSNKDYKNQKKALASVCEQIADGETSIIGLMIESNLVEGSQKVVDPHQLVYGKSITDACVGWEETVDMVMQLAEAVQSRNI